MIKSTIESVDVEAATTDFEQGKLAPLCGVFGDLYLKSVLVRDGAGRYQFRLATIGSYYGDAKPDRFQIACYFIMPKPRATARASMIRYSNAYVAKNIFARGNSTNNAIKHVRHRRFDRLSSGG
jgi:hypothetical protein